MHQVDLHHYGLIRYYNDCIRKVPRWECGMPPQHTREWGRSSSWQDHPVGQGEIIARIRARWKVEGRGGEQHSAAAAVRGLLLLMYMA